MHHSAQAISNWMTCWTSMYLSTVSRSQFHSRPTPISIWIVMLISISCCARSSTEISWVNSTKHKDSRKFHTSRKKRPLQVIKKQMKVVLRCSGPDIDRSHRRNLLQRFWNLEGNRKWKRRISSPSEEKVWQSQLGMKQRSWGRPQSESL